MKFAELNWNDIATKAVITAIPLVFGFFTFQAKTERVDMEARVDRLSVEVDRIGHRDSLRDTLHSRAIRQLQSKAKRGVRFAAIDTMEIEVKRPSRWRRWLSALIPKKKEVAP